MEQDYLIQYIQSYFDAPSKDAAVIADLFKYEELSKNKFHTNVTIEEYNN